jgi:archaetidylinositol phosphate synthase
MGTLLAVVSGFLYSPPFVQPLFGGVFLLASGFFDVVDGSVARVTKKVSRAGAFLDSTLDRLAEIAVFIGIFLGNYAAGFAWLVLLTLAFSLMVSYERARAESLGAVLSGVGVGERAERLLILAVLSLFGFVFFGVVVVFILATITLIQRFFSSNSQLRKQGS